MTKKAWIFALLVGQVFLWTGSAFISVLYRLYSFFTPEQATLYTEVFYYVMQAVGIAAYALWLKRRPRFAGGRGCACLCLGATAALTVLALLVRGGAAVMVLGLFMNVGIGLLSGVYLTRLAAQIPQQCRGRVFGISYAIGSVGTWLLSLPMGGTLLQSGIAVWVFFGLAVLSVGLLRWMEPLGSVGDVPAQSIGGKPDMRLLLLALALPLFCSAVNGLGYYFDAADLSGVLNPAFTRLFYAVGLIAAGVVNDRNRRLGAVACLTALVFPFVSLALRFELGISAALSIFSYIFYGFFSLYRVVLFADLAGKGKGLLPLAVFGLMAGRLGDALGTFGGQSMGNNQILLTCVTAGMLILCTIVFFALYQKLYVPRMSEQDYRESRLSQFEARYGFTARQSEILRLVLDGASNAEISGELFLSENTIKFHMKNILSKTNCTNRAELLALFKAESSN